MIVGLGSVKANLEDTRRTAGEGLAEVERELGLRIRMYPEWITARKLSALDAKDRLERLARAAQILQMVYDGKEDEAGIEVAAEKALEAGTMPPLAPGAE